MGQNIGGSQNRINAGTLESRSVDLPETRLPQAFPLRSGSRNLRFLSRLPNIPTSMYVIHLKVNHNLSSLTLGC